MPTTRTARKTRTPAKPATAPRTRARPGPAKAVKAAKPAVEAPKPKQKLVRDSFTIPKSEYAVLEALKLRAANLKRPTKKSEMLRAGIAVLSGLTDAAFLAALAGVPSLKTGRPKKASAAK